MFHTEPWSNACLVSGNILLSNWWVPPASELRDVNSLQPSTSTTEAPLSLFFFVQIFFLLLLYWQAPFYPQVLSHGWSSSSSFSSPGVTWPLHVPAAKPATLPYAVRTMQARSWEISFSFQLSWCIYLFLCCRLVFRLLASCVENERKRLFFFPVWWLVCVHIPSPPLFFWEIRGIGSPLLSWLSPILSSTDVVFFFFIRKRELIYTERTHTHTKHIRGKEMRARMWRPSDPHVPDVASQPSQAYPGNSSGERERWAPASCWAKKKKTAINFIIVIIIIWRAREETTTNGRGKKGHANEREKDNDVALVVVAAC